jgi:membrane protein YdbS with pleckstrin-like domain
VKQGIEKTAASLYGQLWSFLVTWFRVPAEPPTLPAPPGEEPRSFRPSPKFLEYLKFWFWIGLTAMDGLLVVLWIMLCVAVWWLGLLTLLPMLALAVLPDIVAYVAIHLRYDSTWYVLTSRSLRIRRGIWILHEVTITFENVQNVKVLQGPMQRYFGIANVVVETAGGGAVEKPGAGMGHRGVIEGVANAPEIRELILAQVRQSRSAGLGDDLEKAPVTKKAHPLASRRHVELLREIRSELARIGPPPGTAPHAPASS